MATLSRRRTERAWQGEAAAAPKRCGSAALPGNGHTFLKV
jgi:hypothetical protein